MSHRLGLIFESITKDHAVTFYLNYIGSWKFRFINAILGGRKLYLSTRDYLFPSEEGESLFTRLVRLYINRVNKK